MDGVSRPGEHRDYEQMAVSHVLGGLADTEARVFRAHLLECGHCRARVGELRAIAHDLADVERDERRERAAKAVETKKRDDEEAENDEPRTSRAQLLIRAGMVLGLLALVVLAGWNFALRGTLSQQRMALRMLEEANVVLELGEAAEVTVAADEVQASVKYDEENIVALLDGVEAGAIYGFYLYNSEGTVVLSRPFRALDDRLLRLLPRTGDVTRLYVTRLPTDATMPPEPAGRHILKASVPAA